MPNLSVNCPTCSAQVEWSDAFPERPFCSERCRLIDLGAWSDESYRIPANTSDTWSEGNEAPPPMPPSSDWNG